MTPKFEIKFLRICIKKQVYEGFQENPWYNIKRFSRKNGFDALSRVYSTNKSWIYFGRANTTSGNHYQCWKLNFLSCHAIMLTLSFRVIARENSLLSSTITILIVSTFKKKAGSTKWSCLHKIARHRYAADREKYYCTFLSLSTKFVCITRMKEK